MSWFIVALKKYADFSGRSQRAEYWYYALFYLLIFSILTIIDIIMGTYNDEYKMGLFGGIFVLATFTPTIAVSARRLHDIGRTAWWLLIGIVPMIGYIVLVIFALQDSQSGTNSYGPNPKGL